jgi:hypothetical protein
MALNPILALRIAEDYANAADCILGECPYQTFLVTATNSSIDLDTIANAVPTPEYFRVTIADGYRSYLALPPSDGYLYPQVLQENGMQLFASQGFLTSNTVILGPIVLPYTWGPKTGGIDPSFFQPPSGSQNIKYWIQFQGPGLSPNGNYFDIKEIKIDAMNNINYFLILVATENAPPGAEKQ